MFPNITPDRPGIQGIANLTRADSEDGEFRPSHHSSLLRGVHTVDIDEENLTVQSSDATGASATGGPLVHRTVSSSNSDSRLGSICAMSRRVVEVAATTIVALSPLMVYKDKAAKIISLGGVFFGKFAQLQALKVDSRFIRRLSNSQLQGGWIDPKTVENRLQRNLHNGGWWPEEIGSGIFPESDFENPDHRPKRAKLEAPIEYIENLGRGTVAQIDKCIINGHPYAVKSVSEKLIRNISDDVCIMKTVFFPVLRRMLVSALDKTLGTPITYANFVKAATSLIDEGNLSKELVNTIKQGLVLEKLSQLNEYSIPVPVNSELANYVQRIPVKFKVPRVAENISSSDALVMEFIDGCSFDRFIKMYRRFRKWQPVWRQGEMLWLSTYNMRDINRSLRNLLVSVYVQAAHESRFLNGDFQEGNFMMKLESDHICIYFIDHGNCITVDNFDIGAQDVLCNCLVMDLFLVFYQRHHDRTQEDHLQLVSDHIELWEETIMDLPIQPLAGEIHESSREFIHNWREVFDNQQQSSEFSVHRYTNGMTVREVCRDIYRMLQSNYVFSGKAEQMISEEEFIYSLPDVLSKAALKNRLNDNTNKDEVFKAAVVPFIDYLNDLGLHLKDSLLLYRVFRQIQAYRNNEVW
ncbi:AarF/UbiB family protein [Endozoicomonas sp. YOMI1]|uniref:AarF/UbiB family protein n=1 Tax=Endozoicomonas sp. YOMI1 TaxID=2828739 RepID=UPI002147A7B2|nr:AarF/UbiB family protein [Endozoicomonas sp. YOMI1]